MKKCEVCGKELAGKQTKHCSITCRNTANARKQKKTGVYRKCAVCEAEFYVHLSDSDRRSAEYCSYKCHGVAMQTYPKNGKATLTRKVQSKSRIIRICQHCGKEFESYKKTQKYCSKSCVNEASKVARICVPCDNCGEELMLTYSRFDASERHFCSNECYAASKTKPLKEKQGYELYKCGVCGKEFYGRIYDVALNGNRFCGRDCFAKWKSKTASVSYSRGRGGKREDLDGLYVRSSWEANYARYLNWLKGNGEILKWEYEPETFEFHVIKKGTRYYTPDFKIFNTDGSIEYHEVKGYMDKRSKTKLNRMSKYYPNIDVKIINEQIYRSISNTMKNIIEKWEVIK